MDMFKGFNRSLTSHTKGLKLADELGNVSLSSHLNINICNNTRYLDLAEEVKASGKEDSGLILLYIIGIEDVDTHQNDTRKVLSFYINEDTFKCFSRAQISLQHSLDIGAGIIMVQEK